MILVSPMAPDSGPAARARPARAAGPSLSGGGGGARRGPVAQPRSAAGRGASSLVLRPLPGPSAACRRRSRRFRSPVSRLGWRRQLFRWPRPSGSGLSPGLLPSPGPGTAPPRRGSAPGPHRAALALWQMAWPLAGPRGHPAHQPVGELGLLRSGPRPTRAWQRSPRAPEMEGQISPRRPGSWTLQSPGSGPKGVSCYSAAGEGCNAGVALVPRGR